MFLFCTGRLRLRLKLQGRKALLVDLHRINAHVYTTNNENCENKCYENSLQKDKMMKKYFPYLMNKKRLFILIECFRI